MLITRAQRAETIGTTERISIPFLSNLRQLKNSAEQMDMMGFLEHARPHLARRIGQCGSLITLTEHGNRRHIVDAYFCNDWKICLICAARREFKLTRDLRSEIEALESLYPNLHASFATLTLPGRRGLRAQLQKCQKALKRLNQRVRNAKRGRGRSAVANLLRLIIFFDVTRNQSTGRWNVHLHLICFSNGPFDNTVLKEEWRPLTGATDYNCKSITAGTELTVARYCLQAFELSAADRYAFRNATRGMRLIRRWGKRIPVPKFVRPDTATADAHYQARFDSRGGEYVLREIPLQKPTRVRKIKTKGRPVGQRNVNQSPPPRRLLRRSGIVKQAQRRLERRKERPA